MQTLYKLEQICLLAVVHVCEVWNDCYCPIPPFHMANFKPVWKPVSNRFNAGAFTWPLGVAVNYVMSFVFVYQLGVK